MAKVGIVGASGYTGAELLRLLDQHPDLDVVHLSAESQAGESIAALYPSLAARHGAAVYDRFDVAAVDGLDVVFCGLPHGTSQAVVPELLSRVGHVVDLSADFRLRDPDLYPRWYGAAHQAPHLLGRFAYGLPERFRDQLADADHVAVPGCYPTAAILALGPLLDAALVERDGLIVNAVSGVSGAGRAPKPSTTFGTVDSDVVAYGVGEHRHTPEIEQGLGVEGVMFTPHLVPMTRGILVTAYARPAVDDLDTTAVLEALHRAYDDEPCVVVTAEPPHTKATLGANLACVSGRYDERTGTVVAFAAIDNLVKGASGQAIQCANGLLGLDETAGLPLVGMMP